LLAAASAGIFGVPVLRFLAGEDAHRELTPFSLYWSFAVVGRDCAPSFTPVVFVLFDVGWPDVPGRVSIRSASAAGAPSAAQAHSKRLLPMRSVYVVDHPVDMS
jgi:hypothetical protein